MDCVIWTMKDITVKAWLRWVAVMISPKQYFDKVLNMFDIILLFEDKNISMNLLSLNNNHNNY